MKKLLTISLFMFASVVLQAQNGFINTSNIRASLADSTKLNFPSGYGGALFFANWKNQWWYTEDGGVSRKRAFPGIFSSTNRGLVPASGTPTGKFLKDNGTWDVPGVGSFWPLSGSAALTGTTTITGGGTYNLNLGTSGSGNRISAFDLNANSLQLHSYASDLVIDGYTITSIGGGSGQTDHTSATFRDDGKIDLRADYFYLTSDNLGVAKMGIGETSPQASLHIKEGTPRIALFDNSTSISSFNPAWGIRSADGDFVLQTTTDYSSYTTQFKIEPDGSLNVGGGNGTSGQVLTSNGGSSAPSWQNPAGTGTVTSVGLSSTDFTVSGSPVTSSGSITANLNTTAVTPGSYTYAGFTVDSKGRLTAASNGGVGSNTQVLFNSSGTISGDADMTFTGGNTFNAANATVTANLINSALTSGRVPYMTTSGRFTDTDKLLFDGTNFNVNDGTVAVIHMGGDPSTNGILQSGKGTVGHPTGGELLVAGGDAYGTGNNNGGDLTIKGGTGNGSGRNGYIIILNLPTSSAGLPSGALWNNSGVLSIVP